MEYSSDIIAGDVIIIHRNAHGVYYYGRDDEGVPVVHYMSKDGKKETAWAIIDGQPTLAMKIGFGSIRVPNRVLNNIPE